MANNEQLLKRKAELEAELKELNVSMGAQDNEDFTVIESKLIELGFARSSNLDVNEFGWEKYLFGDHQYKIEIYWWPESNQAFLYLENTRTHEMIIEEMAFNTQSLVDFIDNDLGNIELCTCEVYVQAQVPMIKSKYSDWKEHIKSYVVEITTNDFGRLSEEVGLRMVDENEKK